MLSSANVRNSSPSRHGMKANLDNVYRSIEGEEEEADHHQEEKTKENETLNSENGLDEDGMKQGKVSIAMNTSYLSLVQPGDEGIESSANGFHDTENENEENSTKINQSSSSTKVMNQNNRRDITINNTTVNRGTNGNHRIEADGDDNRISSNEKQTPFSSSSSNDLEQQQPMIPMQSADDDSAKLSGALISSNIGMRSIMGLVIEDNFAETVCDVQQAEPVLKEILTKTKYTLSRVLQVPVRLDASNAVLLDGIEEVLVSCGLTAILRERDRLIAEFRSEDILEKDLGAITVYVGIDANLQRSLWLIAPVDDRTLPVYDPNKFASEDDMGRGRVMIKNEMIDEIFRGVKGELPLRKIVTLASMFINAQVPVTPASEQASQGQQYEEQVLLVDADYVRDVAKRYQEKLRKDLHDRCFPFEVYAKDTEKRMHQLIQALQQTYDKGQLPVPALRQWTEEEIQASVLSKTFVDRTIFSFREKVLESAYRVSYHVLHAPSNQFSPQPPNERQIKSAATNVSSLANPEMVHKLRAESIMESDKYFKEVVFRRYGKELEELVAKKEREAHIRATMCEDNSYLLVSFLRDSLAAGSSSYNIEMAQQIGLRPKRGLRDYEVILTNLRCSSLNYIGTFYMTFHQLFFKGWLGFYKKEFIVEVSSIKSVHKTVGLLMGFGEGILISVSNEEQQGDDIYFNANTYTHQSIAQVKETSMSASNIVVADQYKLFFLTANDRDNAFELIMQLIRMRKST